MTPKKSDANLDRRGFLKGIGTGAAGAATVVAGVAIADEVAAAENITDRKKTRYRESDHIKKYYATNRY